ncbi:hypothetical protein Hypma_000463 [Hypsizygus marmoreus]|uniref:Uncharacterized protein n=1 Tax=Hypsizygus marmoreus TaxID=39966 RepID=A0A369JC88_HYPMA|nr:hypothetical protein Hypma_000463 [Hypsizygus marmoreus]
MDTVLGIVWKHLPEQTPPIKVMPSELWTLVKTNSSDAPNEYDPSSPSHLIKLDVLLGKGIIHVTLLLLDIFDDDAGHAPFSLLLFIHGPTLPRDTSDLSYDGLHHLKVIEIDPTVPTPEAVAHLVQLSSIMSWTTAVLPSDFDLTVFMGNDIQLADLRRFDIQAHEWTQATTLMESVRSQFKSLTIFISEESPPAAISTLCKI